MIVQGDEFIVEANSIAICPITTDPADAFLVRIGVDPSPGNGLVAPSRVMVDKITSVRRESMGRRIGRLDPDDMIRVNRAIAVFLGLG